MAKTKTAKSTKQTPVAKHVKQTPVAKHVKQTPVAKPVKMATKAHVARASGATQPAHEALPATAREAYDRFVHAASDLPASALVSFRTADAALARHNAQLGLDAVMPLRARVAHELPAVSFANLASLPELALAVHYAVRQAQSAPSTNDIASNLSAAHALRGTLLTIADGLARVGLLPAQDIAKIKKGQGPLDAAADCVELSELFTKHEKKISGKHAATAQMLKSANTVGSYLLATLKSSRAKEKKPVNGPALEARDRMWSLLVQRHKELRRVGYYLWDESFNDHVPALLARRGVAKPAAKGAKPAAPTPKSNGASAASASPA